MGNGWDSLSLQKAFADAGYDVNNSDSLYAHFEQYGKNEGLSPSSLFNTEEYLYSKAATHYGRENVTPQEVESMRLAIAGANLNPWDHYMKYGWQEGVNPSVNFDSTAYMTAKLAQTQKVDPDGAWTMEKLEKAFEDQGFSALTHYFEYGQFEDLSYKPITGGTPGKTENLTTGDDTLYGTAGDDYFMARPGTLGDRDYIDGLDGNDTLYAYVGADHNGEHAYGAITPVVKNVENVIFRAQRGSLHSGNNNLGVVAIDAGDIEGMTYLGNDNSRAALRVEDVRTNSNDLTVAWSDADSGRDMDYEVYFNAQNLKAGDGAKSGMIELEIMDAKNGMNLDQPLKEWPFDKFTFKFEANDGTVSPITLTFRDGDNWNGPDATYDTLVQAFRNAIEDFVAENPEYADTFTVEKGSQYTGSASSGGSSWTYTEGYRINIKSTNGSVSAPSNDTDYGWATTAGNVPSVGGITWNIDTISSDCPLIQTNIELDNVGRVQWGDAAPNCLPDNEVYGSESGDLVVGSMANRGGVERFDVTVDRGSWLSSLSSTNNALRMVTVKNADLNGDGKNGNTTAEANQEGPGQLYIGKQLYFDAHHADIGQAAGGGFGTLNTFLDPTSLNQWTDKAFLLSTDGLVDVKYFEGGDFQGNLNIGASLTADSFNKYLRDVDGVESMAGNYAPQGDFTYNLSNQADVINMQVNGGVAADRDFVLNVNAGGGNDFVNFSFAEWASDNDPLAPTYWIENPTDNQVINAHNLGNVHLNGGSGNDTIKVWENAAVTVDGGADNDVIFVSQTVQDQNAVFVFNAVAGQRGIIDTAEGAQSLDNDIQSVNNVVTHNGTASTEVLINMTFKGIDTIKVSLGRTDANGDLNVTADQLNAAIIKAINNDPTVSELLVAKDGAGHSLLVESLIDGAMATGDLTINAYERVGGVDNSITAGFLAANTGYATNFATNDHIGPIVDGTNAGTHSLNVVEGGLGNDVIVLNAGSDANWYDTLLLNGQFGNDTVLNFQTGFDKIDVTSLVSTNTSGVRGNVNSYTVVDTDGNGSYSASEIFNSINGTAVTSSANSVGYIEHSAGNGLYTFFQIKEAGNGVVDNASEIVVLGTIDFAQTGGFTLAPVDGDFIY